MTLLCPFPLWDDGHASFCVQYKYLGTLIPSGILLVSLFLLILRYYQQHQSETSRYQFVTSSDDENADVPVLQQYITTIPPPIAILEALGILVDIVVGVLLLVDAGAPPEHSSAIASVLFDVYLILLVIGKRFVRLQVHSGILYLLQWLCTALIAHAMFVGDIEGSKFITILVRLSLFTILCFIHLAAPRMPTETSSTDDELSLEYGIDETASLLSRLSFFWISDLVWKAYRAALEVSDLYQLNRNQTSAAIIPRFRASTFAASKLLWRIFHFFKIDFLEQGAWAAVNSVAVFMPATLISFILEYLEAPNKTNSNTAWLYVIGLLVSGLLAGIADCQCEWIGRKISTKLRAILVGEIYAKILRKRIASPSPFLPPLESDQEHKIEGPASDGNIFNLMSNDAEIISNVSGNLFMVWVLFPVQTTIGTYLLYRILGVSGVVGVILMVALLPLNILIGNGVVAAQRRVMAASDVRVQSSNELLHNIRTIKYCAWEVPFQERVVEKRQSELKKMRSRFIWWSIQMTVFHSLPFIVTILTFFFYTVVWRRDLETSVAFPALATFTVLRIPLDRMSASITFILEAHVSVLRIEKFLKGPDTDKYAQLSGTDDSVVGFEDATLAWPTTESPSNSDEGSFELRDLQIRFQRDALNVVCGPSGSGKSLLLLGLLGEMELKKGKVFLPHREISGNFDGWQDPANHLSETAAYCPQEPWIMNRSVRENILVGLPFNGPRYDIVLQAVVLLQDLAALDQGDQTLAGENGSRLSGGQKQRVALARALYSPSKYVLLDDCLSAVDSRSANHIFFNAIKGPLMRGRTCILATHHTQLSIPHCDHIVILDAGQVKGQGTAKELVSIGLLGADLIGGKNHELPQASGDKDFLASIEVDPGIKHLPIASSPETELLIDHFENEGPETKPSHVESKPEGSVSWSVVMTYIVAMGSSWYWIIVLCGFAAQQLASLGTNLWIKEWAFQYDKSNEGTILFHAVTTNTAPSEKVAAWYYLAVYGIICITYVAVTFLRDLVTFHGSLKASATIYERLLDSVLHSKLLFFDRVPLGQITNRFSKDIAVLDQSLAPFSVSALQLAGSITMVVLLISVVLPAFLPVAVCISIAYYYVMVVYISGARDLKRIESVERSPLYQQFGETLAGCVSIRAYAMTSMFTKENRNLVDRLNQPYLLLGATKEWLIFRIDLLSSIISFATGSFVLWNMKSISAGIAGLVLTYAVTFTENTMWFVQVAAIIQQNLNAVERIVEYTEIEQEAVVPLKKAVHDIPHDWPPHGAVRFRNYTTRYSPELEPVLKGISFEVKPRERVAIVGRTGAGKSTLTLALIRALESESGSIDIDDVEISSVTLQQLRQAVTVVPQDPKLFDGTLRDNLDPLHRYGEDELLSALRIVCLVDIAADSSVNSPLDHSAAALSRGQRQLLCIARALLRQSRVLVLDEATASIDHVTDAAVQAGLRASVAAGTTVLTIAHRLITIADYDRVVVLEAGRVVEEGSVRELLGRRGESAFFRRMCEESGDIGAIEGASILN